MKHLFTIKIMTGILAVTIGIPVVSTDVLACTGIYAGSSVTANGSVYAGRSEDYGPDFAKQFMIIPARDHRPGEYLEDEAFAEDIRRFMNTVQEDVNARFAADDKAIIELAKTASEKKVTAVTNRLAREYADLVKAIASEKLSGIDRDVEEFIASIK